MGDAYAVVEPVQPPTDAYDAMNQAARSAPGHAPAPHAFADSPGLLVEAASEASYDPNSYQE
jgi:hypothetical protein